MALNPGDLGIDFSDAAIAPAQAKKDGAAFALRYSAGAGNASPKTQHKLCKPGEIPAFEAAGEDFVANSEWYESRITEGAAAGAADGAADLGFWKMRGYAKGATIYVSWDAHPDPKLFDAVAAYLNAYGAALGGYYKVGLYGGTPALREMLRRGVVSKTWRSNAGSWSDDGLPYQPSTSTAAKRAALVALALAATPANLWQTGNYWYSKGADENLVLRAPIGSHLEAKAVPVPTPQAKRHPRWAIEHIFRPTIARLRARIAQLRRHK
jgi:hypothetical protein